MKNYVPVIINNYTCPDYLISEDGNLYSKKIDKTLIPQKTSSGYLKTQLRVPVSLFPNYNYPRKNSKNEIVKDFYLHQLVMSTFRPIDKFPPILLEDWNRTPESAKNIIRLSIQIDHIDGNKTNNHLNNLRYSTPIDNTRNYQQKNQIDKSLKFSAYLILSS